MPPSELLRQAIRWRFVMYREWRLARNRDAPADYLEGLWRRVTYARNRVKHLRSKGH